MTWFITIYIMVLGLLSYAWDYLEKMIYGYAQESIIDTIAGIYIAWRITLAIVDHMYDRM